MPERLGIAGAGAIACGLAVAAARGGDALLWARSATSAQRAQDTVRRTCGKLAEEAIDAGRIHVVTDPAELVDCTFLVEAVVEHHGSKAEVLRELSRHAGPETLFATTTSSLSIAQLAAASGHPERFLGFHVFNPVARMKLVELAFPPEASAATRSRAHDLCQALGKTAVVVPDIPGFVVNRLLFPYLFSAVELKAQTGMSADDIDRSLTLGAGMPMGPLALLDFVGLDIALAIGEALGLRVPQDLVDLVDDGALGRKSGCGFHTYGR